MGGCLPNQPAFCKLNHVVVGELPNSTLIQANAFFLGVHSGLDYTHFDMLKNSLRDFLETKF